VVGPSEAESEYVGAEERKIKSTVKKLFGKRFERKLHKRLSKNYKKNIQIKFSRKNRKI
jgi:citrate lyase gamma subunit